MPWTLHKIKQHTEFNEDAIEHDKIESDAIDDAMKNNTQIQSNDDASTSFEAASITLNKELLLFYYIVRRSYRLRL